MHSFEKIYNNKTRRSLWTIERMGLYFIHIINSSHRTNPDCTLSEEPCGKPENFHIEMGNLGNLFVDVIVSCLKGVVEGFKSHELQAAWPRIEQAPMAVNEASR